MDDDFYVEEDYYEDDLDEDDFCFEVGDLMTRDELNTWLHLLDKDKGYVNYQMPINYFDFAVLTNQGTLRKYNRQVCCGFMQDWLLREVYLSVPSTFKNPVSPMAWKYPSDYKPKVEVYWKWLVSEASPFKTFVPHTTTYHTEEGISAFGFKELEKVNAQFFINYMIAVRAGIERIYNIEVWYDMVENGVDPTLAYFLCVTFKRSVIADRVNYLLQWDNHGHNQFDQQANYKVLLSGPKTRKDTYLNNGIYTPCNAIWEVPRDKNPEATLAGVWDYASGVCRTKGKSRYGGVTYQFSKDEFFQLLKEIKTRVEA